MKSAYFDCFSGISGDMIIGALIDLGLDLNYLKNELKKLNLGNYEIESEKIMKKGIDATKFNVIEKSRRHNKERNLSEIREIVDSSRLSNGIKNTIKKIFNKIAVAEAKIHNKSIDKIHFHEVGAVDAIIDIAGAAIGFKKLGINSIYCSKLNVGTGFVEFSHGKWPVPAPATAEILKSVPIYHNNIEAELVTPTGAAIITNFASKFGEMPSMKVEKIGYGAGSKELEQPNVLRVFIGEIENKENETINVIETNIDNMNPEIYPYVVDRLMESGALDAYLTNIIMKKGRPAIKITVLAENKDVDKLCNIIFDETTTLGVRIFTAEKRKLDREIKTINTKYGNVRVKVSKLNGKIQNTMPEYEDCARIAKLKRIPLKRVYEDVGKNNLWI
ncbi:nickel pincer cofactor biosynthesis protein LarC [Candidatus Woesearchaeota archaeon]|nr:nickel pincer cofactor biosynthesis protein LarC [Candidatus Woesearchaeota archaeon]